MDRYAIITAGGSGTRMGAGKPKQFLEVGGQPILAYTLMLFSRVRYLKEIILTLNPDSMDEWQSLVRKHKIMISHKVVAGGSTRSESIRNGLQEIPNDSLVAIHDAVRPFTLAVSIENSFKAAEREGGAVVAYPCQDSLRKVFPHGSEAVPRQGIYLVQTPQTFKSTLIKEAYQKADLGKGFTDDASVFESAGFPIAIVEGSATNIKITTPSDLELAQFLIQKLNPF